MTMNTTYVQLYLAAKSNSNTGCDTLPKVKQSGAWLVPGWLVGWNFL